MFAVIAGIVLALFFLGLPLAIIGLFIMSFVDQRSPRAGRRDKKLTTTKQDIVVSYPERNVEKATTKRRDEIIVWRNLGAQQDMRAHVGGK
jgi:hypothetical protein